MNTTEKIVELDKYRARGHIRRLRANAIPTTAPEPPERTVKEMAHHLLKALECAKRLL
ncbi:hypothetical protein M3I54_22695 [Paraburkholderia sp. CNPSo 3274]|uniref:hypothetical protein n=1 Tax=Paraburkholderia sp. CNPSo 3274 TaxID=2940932 RepID=UPI0020B6F988|nr:hypothetical protein [Paraburkholderia sp. CNPSo 3274]MCP3709756.1 hypothetical protein [Paraburkholderia sp. CNPSo 3274]